MFSGLNLACPGSFLFLDSRDRIALPGVEQCFGQGLVLDFAVGVAGAQGEDVAVVVALGLEDVGHLVVGDDPVAEAGGGGFGAVVVFADFEPDADGFLFAFGNDVFVVFPAAVGRFRVDGG